MFSRFSKPLRSFSFSTPLHFKFHDSPPLTTEIPPKRSFNIANGNKLALDLKKKLRQFVVKNSSQTKEKPGIAFLVINDRPDAHLYMKQNIETWNYLGFNFFKYHYTPAVDEQTLIEKIQELNEREDVHGIMIQQPLPEKLWPSTVNILNQIKTCKDVEGISDENMAEIFFGNIKGANVPCTPAACLHILEAYNVDLKGKHCVIANKSRIVGLPLSKLLLHENATITVCNVHQSDVKDLISNADIVFAAVGMHDLVKSEWIKDDAIVIDIGMNYVIHEGSKKLVGDIAFEEVVDRVELITPVPGGVGPVTVMMLAKNLVLSWAKAYNLPFKL